MQRDDFIRRVADAVKAGNRHRPIVRHENIIEGAGYVGGGDDVVASMAQQVAEVGGVVDKVPDLAAAREKLRELLDSLSARSALCWRHELLDRLGLAGLLEELGVERLDAEALASLPSDQVREKTLAADVGITSATKAVAETGTLVLAASKETPRVASLLPPVYIAIVERGQMVPDLFDYFDEISDEQSIERLPTNVTFVTGPSKTGDLEMRLITGVHGPGRWHVLLVG